MMIRSLLYVPASSERFVAKAHERGADAIILDLEDAVAPSEKVRAREQLADAAPAVGRSGATVFVRINATPELMFADAAAACRAGAFALFVPKVKDAAGVLRLADHLAAVEVGIGRATPMRLVPMIEDPGALLEAHAIAAASPRNLALILGSEDFATATGGEPVPEVLRLPKLLVHYAAKAAGLLSFGLLRTVADYRDEQGIVAAAAEARRFGFDGATCVHPAVVPILNDAFAPSPEEIVQAGKLLAAAAEATAAGRGAFVFEGRMVDEPIVARARAVLLRGGYAPG